MSFKDIGLKIQLAREEKGMSQEQLARHLGCSQSALSNYEKGKRRLYLSQMEKLSEILGKPLNYFVESLSFPQVDIDVQEGTSPDYSQVINKLKGLNQEQVREVLNYIDYLAWREKRGG